MSTKPVSNSSRKRSPDDDHSQTGIRDAFRAKRPKKMAAKTQPKPQKQLTTSKSPYFNNPSKDSFSSKSNTITIVESTGDIFAAPLNTLLIHACNCQASWSAGIAKAFKDRYPKAFTKYAVHCKKFTPDQLLGDALLIQPEDPAFSGSEHVNTASSDGMTEATNSKNDNDDDEGYIGDNDDHSTTTPSQQPGDPSTHFIGCLFTSKCYGKRKGTPKQILDATGRAMQVLLRKVADYNASVNSDDRKIKSIRMCKINSGLFNVPWSKTRAVLEGIKVGGQDGIGAELGTIEVVSLEE